MPIIALLLGVSIQAELPYYQLSEVEHHPSTLEIKLQKEKKELESLKYKYEKLESKFDIV